jgi:hypothetical protein
MDKRMSGRVGEFLLGMEIGGYERYEGERKRMRWIGLDVGTSLIV